VNDSYDAIVIGSGFGGAVTACRLAQAGQSVAVLERGRRWQGSDFPRAIGQVAGEAFWEEGRSHGFLEYLAFRNVDVVQGAGVGGGSLHYFNVNLRAAPSIFDSHRWPAAIDRDVLEPYYELALGMLESRELSPPPGRTQLPARTSAFTEAARRAGYDTELVPIAVYTGPAGSHPDTGSSRSPCTYCGNCLFGCDVGAKNTLDRNYLALAEGRYGAEILPLHVAESIVPAPGGGYEVRFRHLDEDPAGSPAPGRVRASRVVVAAGALGSTELLLRCRDRSRTLPALSAALGTGFSLNGEFLLARVYDAAQRSDPGIGPPITARATASTPDGLLTVEDLGLPDSLLWYLEGALPPRFGRSRRLAGLALAYLGRALGRGHAATGRALQLDALIGGGRTPHTIPYLGMGTDSSDGRVRLDGDDLEILWNLRRNRPLYREMERVMGAISEAAGGRYATSPLYRWPFRRVATAHPLGGCSMGDDPTTSVVDDRGEVWGYPGLHVIDGSVMPTALAVNPSLTIAALAERSAFWMVHGRELTAHDRDVSASRREP
jgi:cholesterol oxidase